MAHSAACHWECRVPGLAVDEFCLVDSMPGLRGHEDDFLQSLRILTARLWHLFPCRQCCIHDLPRCCHDPRSCRVLSILWLTRDKIIHCQRSQPHTSSPWDVLPEIALRCLALGAFIVYLAISNCFLGTSPLFFLFE